VKSRESVGSFLSKMRAQLYRSAIPTWANTHNITCQFSYIIGLFDWDSSPSYIQRHCEQPKCVFYTIISVPFFLFDPNFLLNSLFSKFLLLKVKEQCLHPYEIKVRISALSCSNNNNR
jgi:hypothetical protein